MTIRSFAPVLLALLLAGCASQSEVDALKKEVESIKAEHAQQHEALTKAVEEAQTELDRCKSRAASRFDESWQANSVPTKGQPGMRTGDREIMNHLRSLRIRGRPKVCRYDPAKE